jgi:hypothetical protein
MTQAKLKTVPTDKSVVDFINATNDPQKIADSFTLIEIMSKLTGKQPKMWGPSIIGFGSYHYKYESGREGDASVTGFSPRKGNLVIYIMPGYQNLDKELSKLGKHTIGKSCLYLKKLDDINLEILENIISHGIDYMKKNYTTDL